MPAPNTMSTPSFERGVYFISKWQPVILVIIGDLFILFTYENVYFILTNYIYVIMLMSFLMFISGNSFILELYSVG